MPNPKCPSQSCYQCRQWTVTNEQIFDHRSLKVAELIKIPIVAGQLGRRWEKLISEKLLPSELTPSRCRSLMLIYLSEEEWTQRRLARQLSITESGLVRMLDTLQEQNLIERHRIPGDRRSSLIKLTPAAEEMMERVSMQTSQLSHKLAEGVSDDELSTTVRVLGRLFDNIHHNLSDTSL